MRYTYSRWDGSRAGVEVEAEAIVRSLTGDLLAGRELAAALDLAIRDGLEVEGGLTLPGLTDLLRDLREMRQQTLEGYDLLAAREQIQERLRQTGAVEQGAPAVLPSDANAAAEGVGSDTRSLLEALHALDRALDSVDSLAEAHRRQPAREASALGSARGAPDHAATRSTTDGETTGGGLIEVVAPGGESEQSFPRLRPSATGLWDRGSGGPGVLSPSEAPGPAPAGVHTHAGATSLAPEDVDRFARRLRAFDALEAHLQRRVDDAHADRLDCDAVQDILGEPAARMARELRDLHTTLRAGGCAEMRDGALQLTPRGMRQIGHQALLDIFRHIERSRAGEHAGGRTGHGGEVADERKRFEFGDRLLLDVRATVMNAVMRRGGGTPVSLCATDFEVFGTEERNGAATVLLVDLSRSMALRGCLPAARKVALALSTLIAGRYPNDRLSIVAFSDTARFVSGAEVLRLADDGSRGTNMQHALQVARRVLGAHRGGTRQIVLITDGEPTAHLTDDGVSCAYPSSPDTLRETLLEVRRCADDGITINTFMLSKTLALTAFVRQVTSLNGGRAFFTTPDRLGEYIVLDYVATRAGAVRRLNA